MSSKPHRRRFPFSLFARELSLFPWKIPLPPQPSIQLQLALSVHIQRFSCKITVQELTTLSDSLRSALPRCRQCARKGCSGLPGAASALEKAVRACPVPPVRSKRLFEPASVEDVRSKSLFECAVQDHYSKVLHSATPCSAPLRSALLAPFISMHGTKHSGVQWLRAQCVNRDQHFRIVILNSRLAQPLWHWRHRSRLEQPF